MGIARWKIGWITFRLSDRLLSPSSGMLNPPRLWGASGAIAVAMAIAPLASAVLAQSPAQLTTWRFDPVTQRLEINLNGGTTPRYFLLAQPARIVLDLPNTRVGNVPEQQTYAGAVRQIRVGQFQPGLTRIVIELSPNAVLGVGQVELQNVADTGSDRWVLRPILADQPESVPPVASRPTPAPPAASSEAPEAPEAPRANAPNTPELPQLEADLSVPLDAISEPAELDPVAQPDFPSESVPSLLLPPNRPSDDPDEAVEAIEEATEVIGPTAASDMVRGDRPDLEADTAQPNAAPSNALRLPRLEPTPVLSDSEGDRPNPDLAAFPAESSEAPSISSPSGLPEPIPLEFESSADGVVEADENDSLPESSPLDELISSEANVIPEANAQPDTELDGADSEPDLSARELPPLEAGATEIQIDPTPIIRSAPPANSGAIASPAEPESSGHDSGHDAGTMTSVSPSEMPSAVETLPPLDAMTDAATTNGATDESAASGSDAIADGSQLPDPLPFDVGVAHSDESDILPFAGTLSRDPSTTQSAAQPSTELGQSTDDAISQFESDASTRLQNPEPESAQDLDQPQLFLPNDALADTLVDPVQGEAAEESESSDDFTANDLAAGDLALNANQPVRTAVTPLELSSERQSTSSPLLPIRGQDESEAIDPRPSNQPLHLPPTEPEEDAPVSVVVPPVTQTSEPIPETSEGVPPSPDARPSDRPAETQRPVRPEGSAPTDIIVAASPNVLIPSGTVLQLRFPRTTPQFISTDPPHQDVFVMEHAIRDQTGTVIAPAGSEVIGRFEKTTNGIRFVTQAIRLGNRNLPFSAASERISPLQNAPVAIALRPNQIIEVRVVEPLIRQENRG